MKKIFLLLVCMMALSGSLRAGLPEPPTPPAYNPHPPQTEVDKKRVAFAEAAIKAILMQATLGKSLVGQALVAPSYHFKNKEAGCINQTSCLLADEKFKINLQQIYNNYGAVKEFQHAHIIPWAMERFTNFSKLATMPQNKSSEVAPSIPVHGYDSNKMTQMMNGVELQKDEYMVHAYARVTNSNRWHHLDVVLSEDKNGNIFLRSFYLIEMPDRSSELPEGVVCLLERYFQLKSKPFISL